MNVLRQDSWKRQGFSLLWDPRVLNEITKPGAVLSLRQFFEMRKNWPDKLPGLDGNSAVVAGIEGCLETLSEPDAMLWLETDLKAVVRSFQDNYESHAALVLWLPGGKSRIEMDLASEEYFWKSSPAKESLRIPIGRAIWAGARNDVSRIIVSNEVEPDPDGLGFVGLHLQKIS